MQTKIAMKVKFVKSLFYINFVSFSLTNKMIVAFDSHAFMVIYGL